MKIKITEIECSANELRQSNTLSDGFINMLKGCFNDAPSDCDDDEDSDEEEGDGDIEY